MRQIDYKVTRRILLDGTIHELTRLAGMWRPACGGMTLRRAVFLADLDDPVSREETLLGPIDCPECLLRRSP